MKALKIGVTIVVVFAALLTWLAPIGPLPGFFIGGTHTEVPGEWGDTRQIHEIQLEVGQGGLPRVVIIWVVQANGNLHIVGANNSGWVSRLGAGGPVRMKMEDKTYSLTASKVTTQWEPILEAYVNKYRLDYPEIIEGFPTVEEAAGTTSVFRLTKG